ncbi:class I adenylate-forming enzyme family protein [Thermoactinomyces sp. CICC 10523]|jgi:acyl-CoA synthetase (AMP-forming)/AMP-acid ligase II|uniref:class I adenylate-forming enzyme family protein n=1 Tax=Thermoactinomyces sp. CICC 10523 TaxID=2767428 RepID=UPI0018DE1DC9|nr:long-chain-fatty-acid--CoA ligase [Thermoactinomyces sp. CICC 10523]MBH8599327.1 long-chain-fatty-acid--CoA ligase [Thermoactinomyces sp. CICC 10523]
MSQPSPTIHGLLERNARKDPDKEAFISATNRLTYAQMNRMANRVARLLQATGVGGGDRMAILVRNNEHFFYAYFALLKAGCIAMPVNVRLTPAELAVILRNSRAKGVVFSEEFAKTAEAVHEHYPLSHRICIEKAAVSASSFAADDLDLPISSREVCEILFTSGTTGVPKGVLFNHERILALASAISIEFQLTRDDRLLTLMPLSHSAPLNCFFMSGLYCGVSHVLGDFSPRSFLKWIHEEKTTFTFAAPVAYLLAAKEPDLQRFDLSGMRVFAYGGGPMPLASYHRVKEAFQNGNFYQVYGLTEAGPNGCLLRPHEHQTKAGSIGKYPVVNMEMRVVREDGSDTIPHEYGEIILRGDSLMLGYDNNPQATGEAIRDGWLYTGDIACRDEDGYVYIVDRKKDVIISGGVNIYPREVEEVLAQHPRVLESCVVGVSHEEWGETVKAVIVPKGEVTEAELREFVSTRLADYKRPRIYSFVKELPRNASGKVLKQQVRNL